MKADEGDEENAIGGNMVGKTEGANFVILGYDYENRFISKSEGVTKKYNSLGQERGFLYDLDGKAPFVC